MKIRNMIIGPCSLAILVVSGGALANDHRPTCTEEPEVRDCVKVEDSDAESPTASVYTNPKRPVAPVARPLPANPKPKTR